MKNLVSILLLIILTTTLYGQVETPPDSIPVLQKGLNRPNEKLNQYLDMNTIDNKNELSNYKSDTYTQPQQKDAYYLELNIPPLNEYVGPSLTPSSTTRYPFANDYSYYSGYGISNNAWLSSSSIQNTYPTLGAIRSVNFNLNYQPVSWLVISGGVYGAKYEHGLGGLNGKRAFNDIGANGALKFILHDRIRLNAYGQYSVYGDKNGIGGPMMNMYPQTFYGGSIELKITEKFGVEGGVIREINPLNGKWENRTFIAPVFYGK